MGDGMRRWGPVDILTAPDNRAVARKLFRYVAAVALAPPATFYAVRRAAPASRHRDGLAAAAAVVVLNALLVAYVVSAFSEPGEPGDARSGPVKGGVGIWKEKHLEKRTD
mmetsp:Transcript_13954/g.41560  ORF Transcript_13954/g.41560 Transcript_13954/m.41560 type:complete len:110 (+) Transcript_13954:360-689(+)